MNDYITNLTLDLNCSKNTPTIDSAQFDKGRVFSVAITADGEPFSVKGCEAILKCIHSDKTGTSLDCTAGISQSGTTVNITIHEDTLPVRGLTAAKLVFTDGTRNYSTQIFLIDVDSSLDGNMAAITTSAIINAALVRFFTSENVPKVIINAVAAYLDEHGVSDMVYDVMDAALQGNPNAIPSLFVKQNENGEYCLVYVDSDEEKEHVIFNFSSIFANKTDLNGWYGSLLDMVSKKANSADVYTKTQVDAAIQTAIGGVENGAY